jgi:Tol biopolymer transport system component
MGNNTIRVSTLAAVMAVCSVTLICAPTQAQILRRLTDLNPGAFVGWSVEDDGSTAVAVWRGDPLGTNPDHAFQIYKWELPGGAMTQLTSFPDGVRRSVSMTDDGEWVVFDSAADPLQQNGDGTVELFLMRSDGSDITQLTNDDTLGGGRAECPMITGSGNRVLFYGTYDPIGTNPDHLTQLFVLDLASSNLTQLTQGESGIHVPYSSQGRCYPAISDDGERVAFSSSADLTGINPNGTVEVFKIDADGQDLAQLTLDTSDVYAWAISGNGERIAYGTDASGWSVPIRVVNWEGTETDSLVDGYCPTINDSGTHVYFSNSGHVYFILRSGGSPRQITPPSEVASNYSAVVSGSRSRVVFVAEETMCPVSPELMAMDQGGNDLQQLTLSVAPLKTWEPDIAADGTRVAFVGHQTCGTLGLYRVDTDGSDPVSVVADDSAESPTITADGETIVFMSWNDLAGTGTCSLRDAFKVQADGSGLAQLTFSDGCQESAQPAVAANGSLVVFQSYMGSFGGLTGDLFSLPPGGGAVTPIVEDGDSYYKRPTVSADGAWSAWHAHDPAGRVQVFRGRTDGSLVEMLTGDPDYSSASADVSGDGRFVAYKSVADPLGTNSDHNYEIFLYDAEMRTTRQLTETSDSDSYDARISDDGEWVYFLSDSPFFGTGPGDETSDHAFRVRVATGVIERVGGLSRVVYSLLENHPNLAVDADGGRVVFTCKSDPTGEFIPGTRDLWLADFDTPATIRPSADAPTVVEWDPDPRALHYDVIRGDVASLAAGPGDTVDLGTVVCLENDTINTNTAGAEADADQPGPGQVFFFLRRWTQGVGDNPSYGQGSGGAERVPSGGDCWQ